MPHRVAALAGHATVYDAEDNAICQTNGPDAETTANRIARALDAAPALLEALEALAEYWRNGTPVHPGSEVANEAIAAIAVARGEVTA